MPWSSAGGLVVAVDIADEGKKARSEYEPEPSLEPAPIINVMYAMAPRHGSVPHDPDGFAARNPRGDAPPDRRWF